MDPRVPNVPGPARCSFINSNLSMSRWVITQNNVLMKQTALCLGLLVSLLACKKTDPTAADPLVGTWRLISYCKANTPTCTNVELPADKSVLITFGTDGTFTEVYRNTLPVDYSFLGCGNGSFVTESGGVRVRASCQSSRNGQLVKIASVTANKLVLNPYGTGEYQFTR